MGDPGAGHCGSRCVHRYVEVFVFSNHRREYLMVLPEENEGTDPEPFFCFCLLETLQRPVNVTDTSGCF